MRRMPVRVNGCVRRTMASLEDQAFEGEAAQGASPARRLSRALQALMPWTSAHLGCNEPGSSAEQVRSALSSCPTRRALPKAWPATIKLRSGTPAVQDLPPMSALQLATAPPRARAATKPLCRPRSTPT
jgi:hypothetical protein